jgi:hypothetical protein
VDSDVIVKDYDHIYENITCHMEFADQLVRDPNSPYYIFNEKIKQVLYCAGAYIYIPNKYLPLILNNLYLFEHYNADDVAFSMYFKTLGLDVTDEKTKEKVQARNKCYPLQSKMMEALECRNEIQIRSNYLD